MTSITSDILRWVLSICFIGLGSPTACGQAYEKGAPYTQIQWSEDDVQPNVWLQDAWYVLQGIDDLTIETIIAFARETYASKWQKRFDEDLVEVLTRMGHAPGKTVVLALFDSKENRSFILEEVPMTRANREALMANKYPQRQTQQRQQAISRTTVLSPEAVLADVDAFEQLLMERFAYLKVPPVAYQSALADLRQRVQTGMSTQALALALQKVLGLFIDGHANIGGFDVPKEYLPFLIRPAEGGFVAFRSDRAKFLDADHPYITQLDGKPIEMWIEGLTPYIPNGSSHYVTHQVLRRLRTLQFVRPLLEVGSSDQVHVELSSVDGRHTITQILPLSEHHPTYGTWPQHETQVLENNLGYLRLKSMNDEAVAAVKTWMPQFADTDGLIIDVRGNGGGSRAALLELFPYFMSADDKPYVANTAKYRLANVFENDHLEARFMYRGDASHWTKAEQEAISRFKEGFRPEWVPPTEEFSAWHYLVLSKTAEDARYHYDKPVVVLMDDRCFSATDIFLGAFKGWRNITLMGSASGGGSARSVRFELPQSRLRGRMASMASFQRNGAFYDGNGIQPDIELAPHPDYYLNGHGDDVLEQAKAFLKASQRQSTN